MISCTLELLRITPPPAAIQEMADRFARAQKRSAQIHGEDAVEIGGLDLMARRGFLNPGVVDQDVEPAECADRSWLIISVPVLLSRRRPARSISRPSPFVRRALAFDVGRFAPAPRRCDS